MTTITATAKLDHPIGEVFAYASDSRNDPEWCESVRSCEQTEGDGPSVGARYLAVHKPGPKASELAIETLEMDPPRWILWRQVDDAGTFLVSYDLEDLGDGRTRLTQTDEITWHGVFKVLGPLVVNRVVRRNLPRQLDDLAEVLAERARPR